MSDELISRKALKKAIDPIKQIGYNTNNEPLFEYVELPDLIKAIDNAQTILHNNHSEGYQDRAKKVLSEERPTGYWIHRRVIAKDRSFDMVVCSNCQTEFSWDAETGVCMDNYKTCPNCSADMGGDI